MGCDSNCSNCSQKCDVKSLRQKPHYLSSVKKVIGVVSGKGGVGKSLVTSLVASKMAKLGYKVGILDADITGPSIPKSFGETELAMGSELGIYPNETKEGIKIMSVNLLVEDPNRPVIFRGPALGSLIQQFYSNVIWGDLDYLFIDMPPGTADVTLTIFQQIPVDGIIVVSTPQDLVKMIVKKSITMADMLNVKVLGLVENMSYVKCPNCNEKFEIFGKSHIYETAAEHNLEVLANLPIDPLIREYVDSGRIYDYDCKGLERVVEILK